MRVLTILLSSILVFSSCTKKAKDNPNPYDNPDTDIYAGVGVITKETDPNTIAGLHKNIFKPTCANSGCHDGNFEPDFRSITSTYNTLVGQPIIKNDELNPLTARVTPGNDKTSMIILRLLEDLNNNSGIMPLLTEPGSDWKDKKDEYIGNIKNWINNGALDLQGNTPKALDFPPQIHGMVVYVGSNLQPRYGTYSPVEVAAGSNIDLWFAYQDDNTPVGSLGTLKVNFSLEANNFNPANELTLQLSGTPKTEKGFYKQDVEFYHKITLNTSSIGVKGDVVWVRTSIDDGVNAALELPGANSLFNAKKYFAIRLK
jgi:hypothetical protein